MGVPKSFIALAVAAAVISAIFFLPSGSVTFLKSAPVEEFNITIYHTRYEPNSISVNQGSKVQLNIVNAEGTSGLNQGITIDSLGIDEVVESETVPESVVFVAETRGVYSAYCGPCLSGPFGQAAPDKRLTVVVK